MDRRRALALGLPVRKVNYQKNRRIPIGYKVSPRDPHLYIPIDYEFEMLLKVWYLKTKRGVGWKALAEWFTDKTGRKVSDDGLKGVFEKRPPSKHCHLPLEEREKLFYERWDLTRKHYEGD